MSLELSLEAFLALSDAEKAPLVEGRAALFAQQFDRPFLDRIQRVADEVVAGLSAWAEGRPLPHEVA